MAPLRAVFVGENASGAATLWVTDGTDTGTVNFTTDATYSELVSANVNPDFTLLGHELLFKGTDASGRTNLWVTDGTTVDTSEITVSSVSSVLSPNINPDFTVFGNEVLFTGYGSNGYPGVWVTNGTSAGTTELTVVGAANNNGFYGSFADFTVLGNEVLFVDTNRSGDAELWVTNGTTAGTTQISVMRTAAQFLGYENPDFTVLGNKALFVGDDNTGRFSLWVTDGTASV
jgi:ELWxxDGT repeat protein